jgi:hypothetical protein
VFCLTIAPVRSLCSRGQGLVSPCTENPPESEGGASSQINDFATPKWMIPALLGANDHDVPRWFILVVAVLLDPAAVLLLLVASKRS